MPTRRAIVKVIGYGLLGMFALAGALSLFNYKNWEPLELPMVPIIGVTVVLTLVGCVVLAKHTRDVAIGAYVFVACGPLACVWLAYGYVPALNALFDDSPATAHRTKVRRFEHRKNDSYWIFIDSWRPGHTEEKLFTTRAMKDRDPAYVDVVSHEGALGLEFVTSIKVP